MSRVIDGHSFCTGSGGHAVVGESSIGVCGSTVETGDGVGSGVEGGWMFDAGSDGEEG